MEQWVHVRVAADDERDFDSDFGVLLSQSHPHAIHSLVKKMAVFSRKQKRAHEHGGK